MKNYLLTLLIINFFSLGCENQKNITDDQVINIVREFFDAFDGLKVPDSIKKTGEWAV